MNSVSRIAKNTSVSFISQIITRLLGFFFIMYTVRYLGAKNFGILSFAIAFTNMFGIFTDFGLGQLVTRETARDRSVTTKYIGNIIVLKALFALLTFIVIVLLVNFFKSTDETRNVVYIIALSVICNSFVQILYAVFQGYEKVEYISAGNILNSAMLFISALIAINKGFSVTGFACLYLISSGTLLSYCLIVSCWKFVKPKLEFDKQFCCFILKEAVPFGLIGFFGILFHWIDSVMLSLLKGDEAVGLYNAAYRLLMVIVLMPSTFDVAIFPVMSRLYVSSQASLEIIYERYFTRQS